MSHLINVWDIATKVVPLYSGNKWSWYPLASTIFKELDPSEQLLCAGLHALKAVQASSRINNTFKLAKSGHVVPAKSNHAWLIVHCTLGTVVLLLEQYLKYGWYETILSCITKHFVMATYCGAWKVILHSPCLGIMPFPSASLTLSCWHSPCDIIHWGLHVLFQQMHILVSISTTTDERTMLQILKYIANGWWICL